MIAWNMKQYGNLAIAESNRKEYATIMDSSRVLPITVINRIAYSIVISKKVPIAIAGHKL